MANVGLHNTVSQLIDTTVCTVKSEISDVAASVSTLDEQMQFMTNRLEAVQTELKEADEELKRNSYLTTEQLETLVQYQLTTIDSTVVGLRACSQYATSIREHLNRKINRLTMLTAILGIVSIAAIIFAIVR